MPGPLSAGQSSMNGQTRSGLHRWMRRPNTPSGVVRGARALLEPSTGWAACETRKGHVSARTARRQRQEALIAFLDQLSRELPASVTHISLVLDPLSVQKGKRTQAWLAAHPQVACHFLPGHCSWMNQVEQWFSILQRKRLRILDFPDLDHLAERWMACVLEWNQNEHPFNWSTKSAAKGMAKCEAHTQKALVA